MTFMMALMLVQLMLLSGIIGVQDGGDVKKEKR